MIIVGLHSDHEAGVCVCKDGKVVAAISEERVNRIKASSKLSKQTILHCLHTASIKPEDVDEVSVLGFPEKNMIKFYGAAYREVTRFTNGNSLFGCELLHRGKVKSLSGLKAVFINLALMSGINKYYSLTRYPYKLAKKIFPNARIKMIPHHEGHSLGSYYWSGHSRCLNIVIEGLDIEKCMVVEVFSPEGIAPIASSSWPHSPGFFYLLVTQLLGFNPYTHAGKVTGLAAYGDPSKCMQEVQKLLWVEGLEIRVHPNVHIWRAKKAAAKSKGKSWMPKELSSYTREDLAAAFQLRFEECILDVIGQAVQLTGEKNIVLSGGCAANVRLNQRIYELPGVESIFIMPPMGDVGQPVGAVLEASRQNGLTLKPTAIENVYLGPSFTDEEVEKAIIASGQKYLKFNDIEKEVARLIHEGNVVARFSGRMEFGPRALGNRSILYHCKDKSVNTWLNKRLNRTEFMPFAPAVLSEHAHECFKNLSGCSHAAEFMTITCNCTQFMIDKCPAAVHVDLTARPQIVKKESNFSFHKIIHEYFKLSGIPCIINTSFNMHEEPIVMLPSDAIRSFLQGHLHYLAINNFLLHNPNSGGSQPLNTM